MKITAILSAIVNSKFPTRHYAISQFLLIYRIHMYKKGATNALEKTGFKNYYFTRGETATYLNNVKRYVSTSVTSLVLVWS